jgi:TolA-binding protein
LSEVLWQQGKQDQANVVLNEALRNYPDNEILKTTRSKLKP